MKVSVVFVVCLVAGLSGRRSSVYGEYFINKAVPTYLYHKFNNVLEDVFSVDVRLRLSMSSMEGTLLYSIDRRMNQLIVTLSYFKQPSLLIEFRNKDYFVALRGLCGCERCQYELLDLTIRIEDKIYIRCNGGSVGILVYNDFKNLNKAYPIPYSKKEVTEVTQNDAHLWLVNTPDGYGLYANPDQFYGCIFDVWYKDEPLIFTEKFGKITNKCKKTCVNDICNGGECYETYGDKPLCNCTKTFLSGDFCNDSLSQINVIFNKDHFLFLMIKVSWSSSSQEIFTLNNPKVQVRLHFVDSRLFFEYNYLLLFNISMKATITSSYTPNKEYIFIANFFETFISLEFYNDGSWSSTNIHSISDLSKELFTTVTLKSGDGKMAFLYKTKPRQEKLTMWRNVEEIKDKKNVSNNRVILTNVSVKGLRDKLTNNDSVHRINIINNDFRITVIFGIVSTILVLLLGFILLFTFSLIFLIRMLRSKDELKSSKSRLILQCYSSKIIR